MLKDELIDRYGSTMTMPDLAEFLHISKATIYNKISQKTFEVPIVKIGGRLVALSSDVADYITQEKLVNRGN